MKKLNFDTAIKLVNEAKTIAICGHINPDGDSIGSSIMLARSLSFYGKCTRPLLARPANISEFDFLDGFNELCLAKNYHERPDLFIAVDVSDFERMGDAYDVFKRAKNTLIIDHHEQDKTPSVSFSVIDPTAASCSIIVWEFIMSLGIKPSVAVAQAALVALITDTGRFQYQNADSRAFASAASMTDAGANANAISLFLYQRKSIIALRCEALAINNCEFFCSGAFAISTISASELESIGASKSDTEDCIDCIRSISNVKIALFMREEHDGIRASIRSKCDIDVQKIAVHFGGGGHKAASGFTIYDSLDNAKSSVITFISEIINETK